MAGSRVEADVLSALRRAEERFKEGDPKRTFTIEALAATLRVSRAAVEDAMRHLAAEHRVCESAAAPGRWMLAPMPQRKAREGAAREMMRTSRAYRDDPDRNFARFRAAIFDTIDAGFTAAQIEAITGVGAAELDQLTDEGGVS